ncbi:MAG UNVERIFIED_CONTAM: histidine phosphatase family protein [Planctomycetaceae bacterium]
MLIRAGSTDYDSEHRLLGTLDVPLNDRGQADVLRIVDELQRRGLRPELLLTSGTNPASGTARAISAALGGVKVKELDELQNVNQGLWQGLPESEVRRRFPRFFRTGKEDPTAICPPEGETLSDACERLEEVLCRAIRRHRVLGIVAPEPLATVIRCTLQHRRPRMTDCLCGEESGEQLQVLETNCFEASGFVLSGEATLEDEPASVHESSNR